MRCSEFLAWGALEGGHRSGAQTADLDTPTFERVGCHVLVLGGNPKLPAPVI